MLLAVDVGNTHTEFGLFEGDRLRSHWRVSTVWERTSDEYRFLFGGVLDAGSRPPDAAAVASVVPPATKALKTAVGHVVDGPVLVVGPGVKTGLPMRVDHPREVGADRVVNAVAAKERYGAPVVVVDFGTATTVDLVGPDGSYEGGAIAPGIEVSQDALVEAAAALRRVELTEPRSAVGRTTVEAMQSGLLYGHAGTVDGLIRRVAATVDGEVARVATGGVAPVIVPLCSEVERYDEFLTLEGLRLVFERNHG